MGSVDVIYDWLEHGPSPECDLVLASALEHVEPTYFERICDILANRNHPISLAALLTVFPNLSDAHRERFVSDPEKLRLGIAEAFTFTSEKARLQALDVLSDHPIPQVAYVLGDGLRDRSVKVREKSAILLKQMAVAFLDEYGPVPFESEPEAAFARERLVAALREAVRTFDRHFRIEPIEAALWFARDLGDDLWHVLDDIRSRCHMMVSERIYKWDSPRMAGFYLMALSHHEWVKPLCEIVARWCTREQMTALLEHSDLLDNPAFLEKVKCVRTPVWFSQMDRFITDLPVEMRSVAPRWVGAAALSDSQKCSLLSRWVHRGCPELKRASVYAIAALELADVHRRLEEVSGGSDGVSTFADWWLAGQDKRGPSRGGVHRSPVEIGEEDAAFSMFWDVCQRTSLKNRGPLIAIIRDNLAVWQSALVAKLRSPEPKDRLLAVQILATNELAPHFKSELQGLLNDNIVSIRELAKTLMKTVARLTVQAERPWVKNTKNVSGMPGSERSPDEIRSELLGMLSGLLSGETAIAMAQSTVDELADLVEQYRTSSTAAAVDFGYEGM